MFHPPRPIYEEATQDLDRWESSTELLAGLLGRAAQAVTSRNSIKAALCMNEVNRLLNIRKKVSPQFLLVFTMSLLWIHL